MSLDFEMVAGDDLSVTITIYDNGVLYTEIDTATEIYLKISNGCSGSPEIEKNLSLGTIIIVDDKSFRFDLVPADTAGYEGTYPITGYVVAQSGKRYSFRNEADQPGTATFLTA